MSAAAVGLAKPHWLRRPAPLRAGTALLAALSLWACAGAADAARDRGPGAALATAPSAVRVLDAGLLRYLAQPAHALPPLDGVPGANPVTTCEQLVGAFRAGMEPGELRERPAFAAWSDCLAGALIARGQGIASGALDLENAGQRIFQDLDLASVPSSLAPRRPADHYHLSDFSFVTQRIEPLAVRLESDSFDYAFEILATGDFRRDGHAAWLVRLTDHAKAGSYAMKTLLLVAPRQPGSALIATDAIELLIGPPTGRH